MISPILMQGFTDYSEIDFLELLVFQSCQLNPLSSVPRLLPAQEKRPLHLLRLCIYITLFY